METFSALLAICAGNSPGTRTKASDAELWCFFDLRVNKRLSKQSWGWGFETPASSSWRHCNDIWFLGVFVASEWLFYCDSVGRVACTSATEKVTKHLGIYIYISYKSSTKCRYNIPALLRSNEIRDTIGCSLLSTLYLQGLLNEYAHRCVELCFVTDIM